MYYAVLVQTLHPTHTHSDAALAQQGVRPHWLIAAWRRLRALAS
jgi:hypothetical protein